MFELSSYVAFVGTSVLLILLPGPAQALTITRALSGGFRAGALTAVGLNVGTFVHALAAGLGLSAILATSAVAFSIVKYVGAAYLLYLGISMLLAKSAKSAVEAPRDARAGSPLREAVLVGVLNPKVALFFLAFLPQFVDLAAPHPLLQFLVLGLTMAVLDIAYELLLCSFVCGAKKRLVARPWVQGVLNKSAGSVMVLLGVRLAIQER